jgi:hypothetical protein
MRWIKGSLSRIFPKVPSFATACEGAGARYATLGGGADYSTLIRTAGGGSIGGGIGPRDRGPKVLSSSVFR